MIVQKFECNSYVVVRYEDGKYTFITSLCNTYYEAIFVFMATFGLGGDLQKLYQDLRQYGRAKSDREEGVEYYVWRIDEYESTLHYVWKNNLNIDAYPVPNRQNTLDEGIYAVAVNKEFDEMFWVQPTTNKFDKALCVAQNKIEELISRSGDNKLKQLIYSNRWYETLRDTWMCTAAVFGLRSFSNYIWGLQIIHITKITEAILICQ